eukprot:15451975-Alexandrium_andersonii.AAC.1
MQQGSGRELWWPVVRCRSAFRSRPRCLGCFPSLGCVFLVGCPRPVARFLAVERWCVRRVARVFAPG